MYESVMGLRKHEGQGCILADAMYVSSFFLLHRGSNILKGAWGKHYRCVAPTLHRLSQELNESM